MDGPGLMAAKSFSNPLLDAGFANLKSRIIERTGHFYYQDKDDLLWERVRKRMRATGSGDSGQYLALLDDKISGPTEWTKLEAEITIGETFFFRYAEQFTALRDTISPRSSSASRATGDCASGARAAPRVPSPTRLPFWSANYWVRNSNNGARPSWARISTRAFWRWRDRRGSANGLALHATDGTRPLLPSGKGEQWQLRPEFRSLVRFERHNLLSLLDGTSPLEFSDFDLILCRNVLIYFHPDTVAQVVQALRDCLSEKAWMLLGHAEPSPVFASMMQSLSLPGTVAYRQGAGDESASTESKSPGAVDAATPTAGEAPGKAEAPCPGPPQRAAGSHAANSSSQPEPGSLLDQVRDLANLGDFRTAQTLCTRALAAHPFNPALHLYHGLIAQALNRPEEAEKSFLKGIYLDKSFAMAHYHLGLLLLAEGRPSPGRRALTNAASIATGLPDDQEIEEADGLTARDLRNLVRIHLEAASRTEQKGRR